MRLHSERIITPGGTVSGDVVVADGRIAYVGAAADDGGDTVDVGDDWVAPGFIDVHVHGGGGAQCNTSRSEEVAEVADFHARHGTTGLLATTVAAPEDELCSSLGAIASSGAPSVLGAHLEGPFLSPERPGAMDPSMFRAPALEEFERLLAAGDGAVRVMTLAPELLGALELIERAVASGVVVSIGHTNATDAEVRAAVLAGATAATHVFNAMRPFGHRDPGVVGAVLELPEISAELICDGVHVDPVAMRLLHRLKGPEGVRLVTDAMAAAGMPDGEYRLGERAVTVSAGRAVLKGGDSIAGSTLTMQAAVQNAVSLIGASPEQAVQMASTNPARLLGLEARKGEIRPGLDADLVVLDESLAVQATMITGQWVWRKT